MVSSTKTLSLYEYRLHQRRKKEEKEKKKLKFLWKKNISKERPRGDIQGRGPKAQGREKQIPECDSRNIFKNVFRYIF